MVAVRDSGGGLDLALLTAMSRTLAHRGPDDDGLWHTTVGDTQIGLAHRRLAVIHRDGSHQPMVTSDGRYALVFNGEILNFRDLRRRLSTPPPDDGDVAVLLHGLVEFGVDFLQEIRGQFAFVLVDSTTGQMIAARDPLGILPLFYAMSAPGPRQRLVIASEPKAILRDPTFTVRLAEQHLPEYLLRRSVPAPNTLLAGIHKLRPGHLLTVNPTGVIHEEPYWSGVTDLLSRPRVNDYSQLSHLLQGAVDRNLVADGPVGVFLSGGLDSTLITALVRRRCDSVSTYSAGFGDPDTDETGTAAWVAARLGTAHHEVGITAQMYADAWRHLSRARDAPLSEPADIALHHLARRAKQDVTVILSGEGADELFAGYPKYLVEGATRFTSRIPGMPGLARRVRGRFTMQSSGARSTLRALEERDPAVQRSAWFAPFTSREIARLTGQSGHMMIDTTSGHSARDGSPLSAAERMIVNDLTTWLPDNLLERADRMCMAASLEVRPPFLDLDLVDMALRLPMPMRVRHFRTKWPLRQLAADVLPDDLAHSISRRAKSGFRVPLDKWFRGDLRDHLHDHLMPTTACITSYLDHTVIRQILLDHDRARADHGLQLWTLLSLEHWMGDLPVTTHHHVSL